MGSSTDGLTAAQSAQPEADPDQSSAGGLLRRLFRKATPLAANVPLDLANPETTQVSTEPAPLPGIGNLRRLRVDDVAIPKVDIVAVPLTIGRDALAAVFREHGFSRLPVFNGTLDDPQGVVTLKDLALTHGFGAEGDFDLAALLRPLIYVPPSMPLTVLLQKMQSERIHMALVIDEYGGVDGLVTIEDLLETVVGDIADEHDIEETAPLSEEAPGVWMVQAMAEIDAVEAATGLRLRNGDEDQDIDTIGGLVYLRAGRVPAVGEIIPHESGAEFEIIDAEPRRIRRLQLRLPVAVEPAADPA